MVDPLLVKAEEECTVQELVREYANATVNVTSGFITRRQKHVSSERIENAFIQIIPNTLLDQRIAPQVISAIARLFYSKVCKLKLQRNLIMLL